VVGGREVGAEAVGLSEEAVVLVVQQADLAGWQPVGVAAVRQRPAGPRTRAVSTALRAAWAQYSPVCRAVQGGSDTVVAPATARSSAYAQQFRDAAQRGTLACSSI
jgi:hypothetical protein